MPEQKYFQPSPAHTIAVCDRNGKPLSSADVRFFTGRRVKWTKRVGSYVFVMLDRGNGVEGVTIRFSVHDYDKCIRREFAPGTS